MTTYIASIGQIGYDKTMDQTGRFQEFMKETMALPSHKIVVYGSAGPDQKACKSKLVKLIKAELARMFTGPAGHIDWGNMWIHIIVTEISEEGTFHLPPYGNNGGRHYLDKDEVNW